MPVKIIYKNRCSDVNKIKHFSTDNSIERLKRLERRKLEEKLKHLINNKDKGQNRETQKIIQLGSGNVIRKRKAKKGIQTFNEKTA
jgi:hypothetical protein